LLGDGSDGIDWASARIAGRFRLLVLTGAESGELLLGDAAKRRLGLCVRGAAGERTGQATEDVPHRQLRRNGRFLVLARGAGERKGR